MIGVAYGTTGELIKLSPILTRLNAIGSPALTLCTGQQVEQIPTLLDDFGLPQPDIWLSRREGGRDLERPMDLIPWASRILTVFARHRQMLRERMEPITSKPLLLVHGDTLTTVLGSLMGHTLRVPVAHIEAGLRSGNWRNPFPEELNRRAVARLARIHFAPGLCAAENLRTMKVKGEIVDTTVNTMYDALDLVQPGAHDVELPSKPFGLVSLHRFELLGKPRTLQAILELLHETSRSTPILFVDHPVTMAAIATNDLDSLFDEHFRRIPRQRYFHFIALLRASTFLVTDSGGSQEECARLGHPCLVHRAATERDDGLNGPVVLSRMDLGVVQAFLRDPMAYAHPAADHQQSATSVIVDHLRTHGYIEAPTRSPLVCPI